MQFTFVTGAGTYDLTDYVDRMDIEVERVTASTSAGLFVPSSQIGASWNAGFYLNTSGIIAASDYPALRSIIAQILDHRSGYLQIESDRRIKAVLDSVRFSEWEGGTPLMRLSMRWLTAGYAESVEITYATPISGGWQVQNDGDLPAPMDIFLDFGSDMTDQRVLIQGGSTPDGNYLLNFEWKGDVTELDGLFINAGALGGVPSVRLGDADASDKILSGYPPYAGVGTSTITYSLDPPNSGTAGSLIFRKRWRIF